MIKKLFDRYQHIIVYIFFGAVTTAVNFIIYYPLYNVFNFTAAFSNVIAWLVAVVVAFLTNKPFVFHSYDWSFKVTLPEFWKFVFSRIGSGVLETGLIYLLVDIARFNGNIVKILISVAVIVLNYISSKFFVFKSNK